MQHLESHHIFTIVRMSLLNDVKLTLLNNFLANNFMITSPISRWEYTLLIADLSSMFHYDKVAST